MSLGVGVGFTLLCHTGAFGACASLGGSSFSREKSQKGFSLAAVHRRVWEISLHDLPSERGRELL